MYRAHICNCLAKFNMIKLNSNLFNINSNYVGYLKVDAEYGQILQSEPCEFSNKNFEMVTSEFSVPGPMKVKIICGIKSNSNDYQLTALDKVSVYPKEVPEEL